MRPVEMIKKRAAASNFIMKSYLRIKNVHSDACFSDLLPALDGDAKTMTFLQEVVDILLAYIVESFDRESKVIDFHYPNELMQLNNWELQGEPATLDDILISCRATLKYAIKTGGEANPAHLIILILSILFNFLIFHILSFLLLFFLTVYEA